eukprot:scaffold249926_cov13-Tisochrysis_lutea.AAC.1
MPWLHCRGMDKELCLFVEHVRLPRGPSSGSSTNRSVCTSGSLVLMLGASRSGVFKASLASGLTSEERGQYVGLSCVQQE